ncbi:unnamed protein product [Arabidopsis halleri]
MTNNDFILARNSEYSGRTTNLQFLKLRKILDLRNYNSS